MDKNERMVARHYPESRFGGYTDIDGTVVFYTRVNALLGEDSVVLDAGCGRGEYGIGRDDIHVGIRVFKGRVKKVIGIDRDPKAESNPYMDEFRLIDGPEWPVESDTVDLCVCDKTVEHLDDPRSFFAEAARVIKPGGMLCARTSNRLSYIALAARLVPDRRHAAVVKRVQDRRSEEDVFPTLYRCNTVKELRRTLEGHGFDAVVYTYEAEPRYLFFSGFAYWLGVLHQRFAPALFKPAIFAFARLRE